MAGSKAPPARLRTTAAATSSPAEHALEGGVAGDVDDPHRAAGSPRPWTAPAGPCRPSARRRARTARCTDEGRPSRSVEHGRHLAERGDVALEHPAPRAGSPRTICRRPHRCRAARGGERARDPRRHLGPRPEPGGNGVLGERVVVAEELGGHVRVGGAADVEQQAGVVGLGGRLLVDAEPLGEPHRDRCSAGRARAPRRCRGRSPARAPPSPRRRGPVPRPGLRSTRLDSTRVMVPRRGPRGVSGPGGASAAARASRRPAGGSCRGPR